MKIRIALFIICSAALLTACNQQSKTGTVTQSSATLIDTLPGTCPFLTKDQQGHVVLSWVRETSDSTAVFCYAVSPDGGKAFGNPIVIPSSTNVHPHSENIPKVLFSPSGAVIAAWGTANPNPKNEYSGLVNYAQSFDDGKTWTAARTLVSDTAGFDQRYFDMALLPGGEAGITWLDNRKTNAKEGSTLYYATTNGKSGFEGERMIHQQCCQCCRTDLFVDHKGGIHIIYRGIINDSIRDMMHTVSIDGGRSFTKSQRISRDNWVINACPHTGPAMAENEKGLHFTWFTGGAHKGSYYTKSWDDGTSFATRDSISNLGSHPQLISLRNGELVIVRDETFSIDGKLRSRIGVQHRSKAGKTIEDHLIAEDSFRVTYPVITETAAQHTLIAFCQQRNGKTYVVYQQD
jgi:hypothetical protein